MTTTHCTLALCLLAGAASAQQYTSPSGYLTTEGSGAAAFTVAYNGTRWYTSYAHVDDTLRGQGSRTFTRVSLRRDGETPTSSVYGARQSTIAIRIATADWTGVVNNEVQPDTNYRVGWWSNAFTAKSVSLPSLATQPVTAPAPFAIHMPLDVPFPYSGAFGFTLQLRTSPSSLGVDAEYPIDRVETTSSIQGPTTTLGTGCTVAGRTTPMLHRSLLDNYGEPGMSYWQLVLNSAPASSPTVLLIGTAGADLPFGGCTNLRVAPVVIASGLPTSATGFCNTTFSFRHHGSFVGAKLYTQIACPDAGQPGVPGALSNGVEVTYPRNPILLLRAASGTSWVDAAVWPASHRLTKGVALVLGLN